ncbi:insulin [Hypanus sabinus]|uniref:insulin n=1 Tax=Hypanus sabinus TaxID=79690 RepID=UPI0028C3A7F0|nr:insulin [Hypanus sabinus]
MVFWSQIVLVSALIIFSCPKGLETLSSQHLCGSHLVETLYFVCGGKGFYYVPKVKRGVEQFLVNAVNLKGAENIQASWSKPLDVNMPLFLPPIILDLSPQLQHVAQAQALATLWAPATCLIPQLDPDSHFRLMSEPEARPSGLTTLQGEESIQENEIEHHVPFNKLLERMKKRGIVESCCHNTCSLFDLEGYCNQ